ncbi:hypothetical protein KFS98_003657 [Salmonella enterica]|nr:hypothetical protein [Salmonella enterica]
MIKLTDIVAAITLTTTEIRVKDKLLGRDLVYMTRLRDKFFSILSRRVKSIAPQLHVSYLHKHWTGWESASFDKTYWAYYLISFTIQDQVKGVYKSFVIRLLFRDGVKGYTLDGFLINNSRFDKLESKIINGDDLIEHLLHEMIKYVAVKEDDHSEVDQYFGNSKYYPALYGDSADSVHSVATAVGIPCRGYVLERGRLKLLNDYASNLENIIVVIDSPFSSENTARQFAQDVCKNNVASMVKIGDSSVFKSSGYSFIPAVYDPANISLMFATRSLQLPSRL